MISCVCPGFSKQTCVIAGSSSQLRCSNSHASLSLRRCSRRVLPVRPRWTCLLPVCFVFLPVDAAVAAATMPDCYSITEASVPAAFVCVMLRQGKQCLTQVFACDCGTAAIDPWQVHNIAQLPSSRSIECASPVQACQTTVRSRSMAQVRICWLCPAAALVACLVPTS